MTDQEKNEAIARKLGWKQVSSGKPGHADLWIHPTNEGASEWDALPYYHSIEAAWEVVEHLKSLNESCYLVVKYNNQIDKGGWAFEFWNPNTIDGINQTRVVALSDTAPRAICEAFLKLP